MEYRHLKQEYKDDTLADALYAREVEYFHYEFDRNNFIEILKHVPEGEYKTQINNRLVTTEAQMAQVKLIYEALQSQITDINAHTAAVERARIRREKIANAT